METPLLIAIIIFAVVTALLVRPAIRRAYANYNLQRERDAAFSREVEKIEELPDHVAEEQARALMQKLGTGEPAPEQWNQLGYYDPLLHEFFSRCSLLSLEDADETLSAALLRRVAVESEPFVIIGAEESHEFSYGVRETDGAVFSLRIDEDHDEFTDLLEEDVDFFADSVAKFLLLQAYMISVADEI